MHDPHGCVVTTQETWARKHVRDLLEKTRHNIEYTPQHYREYGQESQRLIKAWWNTSSDEQTRHWVALWLDPKNTNVNADLMFPPNAFNPNAIVTVHEEGKRVFDGPALDLVLQVFGLPKDCSWMGRQSRAVSFSDWVANAFRGMPTDKKMLMVLAHASRQPLPLARKLFASLPQVLGYSDVADQALGNPVWRDFWRLAGKGGATVEQGAEFLTALMMGTYSPPEKTKAMKQLAEDIPPLVLREWWERANHRKCLERGMFASWFAVAQGIGLSKDVVVASKKELFVRELFEHMDQLSLLSKYKDQLLTLFPLEDLQVKIGVAFWEMQETRTVRRGKPAPLAGWKELQQHGLVPSSATWAGALQAVARALEDSDASRNLSGPMFSYYDSEEEKKKQAMLGQHVHAYLQHHMLKDAVRLHGGGVGDPSTPTCSIKRKM